MATSDPTVGADLEGLEQEREFLLRSLADLDAEHEAGDIEDEDYRSLSDDYTARAAAVLRAIEAAKGPTKRRPPGSKAPSDATVRRSGSDRPGAAAHARRRRAPSAGEPADAEGGKAEATPEAILLAAAMRSRKRWRTAAVAAGVVGFGALAAWVVAQSSGSRLPGQTASGNSQLTTATSATGGVDQRLIDAANLVNQGKVTDALKRYDAVLKDDPNQPVALADGGWLEAQAGLAGNQAQLVDTGLVKIEKAEKIDSSFADAHFFRGFLLLRAKNDGPDAVTELRLYLGMVNPSAPQVTAVQTLLQEAIKAAGPNVPPGPNAPTTTAAPQP